MKIVIATGLYPPEIGGPATYAAMLKTELPPLGIEVTVVPFGLVRSYPKIIRHFVYTYKLWIESSGSDVVYALDPISVGLSALWVSRLRKTPFLIRLGGDYAWEQGRVRFGVKDTLDDYLSKPDEAVLAVRMFAKLQTYVVSKACKVILPSNYLKSVVMKWGIDESKIQVIYSALFPLQVTETKEKLRSKLNYSYPTIMSAARLVPWKGFPVLISVVAKLKSQYPDISLIIAGSGAEKKRLEAQVLDLNLEKHVKFTGDVSKDTLGALIKTADVFVLNTAYEGLSHQLIEVMDIGTPIVTTTAGGNTELITDGIDGLLVEFNDQEQILQAVNRILNNQEIGERIVQSARGRSKLFSKVEVISEIKKVFESII